MELANLEEVRELTFSDKAEDFLVILTGAAEAGYI